MRYLLLIYNEEKLTAKKSEDAMGQLKGDYRAYTASLKQAGKMLAGDALQPTATATSVRVRSGKTLVTDGPFAETKEQLGGFYMVEAKDLDEAIKWAAGIPGAREGTIEVRPIWELPK